MVCQQHITNGDDMNLIHFQGKRIKDLNAVGIGGLLFSNHTHTGGFTRWSPQPAYPIDYRSILANEIVIETDAKDPKVNTRIAQESIKLNHQ